MPGSWSSWRSIVRIFAALLVAGIALGQLQGLLQGMHLSAHPAGTIGSLNHLRHWKPDYTRTAGVVAVWKDYSEAHASSGTADAHEVASWAVAVDAFLFAPLYALGLFLLFVRVRKDRPDHAPLAYAGMGLIAAAFVADEIENYANIAIVRYAWVHGTDTSGTRFHALAWLLWVAGWAKWILVVTALVVAVILVLILVGAMIAEPGSCARVKQKAWWAGVRRRIHLLRFQLILVALMALVPFAHEQIADLIRRWSVRQLALTALLAWALAMTAWLVARRLLIRGQWKSGWSAATRKRVGRILVLGLVAAAAIQVLFHYLTRHDRYRPGWGLLVPAAIVTALAVIGLFVKPSETVGEPPSGDPLAPEATHPRLPRLLGSFVLVAFGLGILHASFGYAVYVHAWTWQWGSLVALALVVAGAIAARLLSLEPLVGGLAGAVAGLVVLYFTDSGDVAASVLVGAGILCVIAGLRLFDALGAERVAPPQKPVSVPVTVALAAVFALFYAAIVVFPFDLGEWIGGVGVLLLFMTLLTCVGALLVWITPSIPVPRSLVLLRVRRFPILVVAVLWFLLASSFDPGGYHNVRLVDARTAAKGVTLGEAWRCWLAKNRLPDGRAKRNACAPAGPRPTKGAKRPIPFVLLATTGGGIRAAYWTDLVLDCAFEARPGERCPTTDRTPSFARSDRLFTLSGISGGSLGLAEYAAYLSDKPKTVPNDDWVQRVLDADSLSASGAWWLFVEIPRTFLQFDSPTDRAAILERGWERQWPHHELEEGLLELWRTDHHEPLLLLNGTSVQDGCRFETSPLDANVETRAGTPLGCKSTAPFDDTPVNVSPTSVLPATRDLVDFLCGEKDVRLSTAALLSGRFPFVNPSARVVGRCRHADTSKPIAYVVDGGYLDTSGASPIGELMTRLQPLVDLWNRNHRRVGGCIVPVMIQVDNGFPAAARAPGRPGELTVPLTTLFATRGAREAEARIGEAESFSALGGAQGDRWAHFVNETHAGPKAPLGWTQSRFSEDELTRQLHAKQNKDALEKVRGWFAGRGLSCAPAP